MSPHSLSRPLQELLATFSGAFTRPTYEKALVLLRGALMTLGARTVTAALRVQELQQQSTFGKYHRFFSRDRWSPLELSRLLLGLILRRIPEGLPLVLLIDETLERRRGRRIRYKSWFRDPVRSSPQRVCFALGLRWCCVCALVSVPWSRRPWALPFFAVPVLSEKVCQKLKKRPRSSAQWAALLLKKVAAWYPERELVLVGDGAYAVMTLVRQCQQAPQPVTLVSRLRLDAALFDFPAPSPPGRPGRKPKKGVRQPSLAQQVADSQLPWRSQTLPWYAGQERLLELRTGVCLWYSPRHDPVPIRWVLLRCPRGDSRPFPPTALFSSEVDLTPEQIVAWFVGRWSIEVTFEELRAHLGFETQRHWSPRALDRTTPCLMGLFSLVVLMALEPFPRSLPFLTTAWYPKQEATFSDALAAVRHHLWSAWEKEKSESQAELCQIPRALLDSLQRLVCYAA